MPNVYDINQFRGIVDSTNWSQVIETPGGVAILEVETPLGGAEEKGLQYAHIVNRFLQTIQTLESTRAFFSSIQDTALQSLIIINTTDSDIVLAIKGTGNLYLQRNKTWVPLLQGSGVLKGSIKEGDTILCWTKSVTSLKTEFTQITSNISSGPQLVETINELINSKQEYGSGIVLQPAVQIISKPIIPLHNKPKLVIPPIPVKDILLTLRYKVKERPFQIKIIALLLGIIFVISVVLGVQRQQNNETYANMETGYARSQQLFTEAIAVMDSQPDISKEKLTEAKNIIDTLIASDLPKSKTTNSIHELKQQIDDNVRTVSKVYSVELEEYFDASFLRTDRVITQMALVNETVFFVDNTKGFLAGVALANKNADIVSGDAGLIGTTSLTGQEGVVYALTPNQVLKFTPNTESAEVIVLPNGEIQSKDMITSYGRNIYIIDKGLNQVWRFIPDDDDVFGSPQEYFDEDVTPNLSQISNVHIDGSIWFGTNEGKIYKYTQGRDDPFLPRGVEPPLGKELIFYTNDTLSNLYVLDKEHSRVVVLAKDGKYLSQYQWTDANPVDVAVSEEQKRVILLLDQKLFSFALQ